MPAWVFPHLRALLGGQPVEAGPVRLSARRIYILPTRHGLLFAAFLLGMLVASVNYGLSLGYALTFLLAGVALAALFHTWRNLWGITLTPMGAGPAFAGGDAAFHLAVDAPSPRYGLILEAPGAGPVRFDLEGALPVTLSVPAGSRGRLMLPRLTLSTVYPLGLFRAWAYARPALGALVYPRPAPRARPTAFLGGGTKGSHASEREGREDFAGLRRWRVGDSPRQVAWKVLARGGPLTSKRFTEPAGGSRRLDWDDAPGDVESRLSWLTRAVLDAEDAGLPYALSLPGRTLGPDRGAAHRHACLSALALFGVEEA